MSRPLVDSPALKPYYDEGGTVDAETQAPEGWMAFDPYTRCTYCPECVEAIWPDPDERHGIGFELVPGTVA